MGTPIEGEVQGIPADPGNTPGPNPAWNDVLGVLPEQFHSVVTPHFQQWDQAAQSRIEAANSQVKEFEPYKAFIEHGIDPAELENGLRLMYEINNNPQNVWNALGKAYNLAGEAGNESEDDGDGPNVAPGQQQTNFQDPRFDQLQQGMELVSQIVLEDQQAKQEKAADQELEAELSALKTKHGEYDERFVLAMMSNGMDGETAIQAWNDTRNSLLQNNPRPFAPHVMGNSGGGSGLPSQAVDPTKLSGKDTRNLVAQMLAAEFGQRT